MASVTRPEEKNPGAGVVVVVEQVERRGQVLVYYEGGTEQLSFKIKKTGDQERMTLKCGTRAAVNLGVL